MHPVFEFEQRSAFKLAKRTYEADISKGDA